MDNPEHVKDSSILNANTEALFNRTPPKKGSPRVTVEQLMLAGAHFGHLTERWNPKMKPYIFTASNGIYIIDLQKTQPLIEKACEAVAKIAASGEDVLFLGTKKQAHEIIESEAKRASCPYVTYRWLGGMLTNFATIRRSLKTLESLERMASDGTYEKLTKKEQLSIEKSKGKLTRTLGGIRDMKRLPGGLFVVDTKREAIGIAEARKLGIPIFAIVDTNVDPELVDYPIPANDDAFKSIWLITHAFADAFLEGKRKYSDKQRREEKSSAPMDVGPKQKARRSRRRRSGGNRPPRKNAGPGVQKSENQESSE